MRTSPCVLRPSSMVNDIITKYVLSGSLTYSDLNT